MKIALIGSAPDSIKLAPYTDPSWSIWGCSPGVYWQAGRTDVWFELHRWEPPVLGNPSMQRPWFSPEYCAWMAKHPNVWMAEKVPEIPGSRRLPHEELTRKYGHYFFTSSLAWMFACAIDEIEEHRAKVAERDAAKAPAAQQESEAREPDMIGLWGVDMAATEEYGYQRAGCQFFAQIAASKGIRVIVPPESDLMVPPPLYGISENDHRSIKMLARKNNIVNRLMGARQRLQQASEEVKFLEGAIDDINYHLNTWIHEGAAYGTDFPRLFKTQDNHTPPPLPADTPQQVATSVLHEDPSTGV